MNATLFRAKQTKQGGAGFTRLAKRLALGLAGVTAPWLAHSHDGHDAPAAHLHGWDWLALVALAAVGVLWWLRSRR